MAGEFMRDNLDVGIQISADEPNKLAALRPVRLPAKLCLVSDRKSPMIYFRRASGAGHRNRNWDDDNSI